MNRATIDIINNDREITRLRMQAEDLINNMESMDEADFEAESKRIENEITQRFELLYAEYKK